MNHFRYHLLIPDSSCSEHLSFVQSPVSLPHCNAGIVGNLLTAYCAVSKYSMSLANIPSASSNHWLKYLHTESLIFSLRNESISSSRSRRILCHVLLVGIQAGHFDLLIGCWQDDVHQQLSAIKAWVTKIFSVFLLIYLYNMCYEHHSFTVIKYSLCRLCNLNKFINHYLLMSWWAEL